MLQKCISIILATLIMAEVFVPGMELHELSKLPALVDHYQNHKQQQPHLSFLAFVELHYQNPDHHQQDSQTHHKLPFSSHHHLQTCAIQLAFEDHSICISCNLIPLQSISDVIYKEPVVADRTASIWQPPKLG